MATKSWRNKLTLGLLVLTMAILLTVMALPVAAAPDAANKAAAAQPNTVTGTVTAVATDKTSFTLAPPKGDPTTIKVDANTKYFVIAPLSKPPIPLAPKNQGAKPPVVKKDQNGKVERGLGDKKGLEKGMPNNPKGRVPRAWPVGE